MIRMSVLSAWAELQVASTHQGYLVKVVKPHVAKLTPLWLSSLQEFARLRFEPDISNNTGPARLDESLDVIYAALNRQTLLKVLPGHHETFQLCSQVTSFTKIRGSSLSRPLRALSIRTLSLSLMLWMVGLESRDRMG